MTGLCKHNTLQITARHHRVKKAIQKLLTEKGWSVYDEVHGVETSGRNRRSDIIAFDPDRNQTLIIDPTVRYESNDVNQEQTVIDEKRRIYEQCIPYYKEKYTQKYGDREWRVIGLWFGARGSVGDEVIKFFNEVKLKKDNLIEISNNVICDTIRIIHNHIYHA